MSVLFVVLGYVVPILWFVAAEVLGLRKSDDAWPPFTHVIRGLIARSKLFAGLLLWFLVWTIAHFYLGVA